MTPVAEGSGCHLLLRSICIPYILEEISSRAREARRQKMKVCAATANGGTISCASIVDN
jgi:hypothetical protein